MSYLQADASYVKKAVHDLLTAYPELAEDEELKLDTLEGETDFNRIVTRCLNERLEADTLAKAIKEREGELRERRSRFERKADAMKKLIKDMMDSADIDKLTLPEATLSVTSPRTSVNVLDVEELPQGYYKTTRSADKTAIKSALEAGETIPGAELALGESGLTIRTK